MKTVRVVIVIIFEDLTEKLARYVIIEMELVRAITQNFNIYMGFSSLLMQYKNRNRIANNNFIL